MVRPAQDVTDAELAILEVLWQQDDVTARRIKELLYPNERAPRDGTIQKLLDRLKAKKFIVCDRSVWPYRFSASVAREELIGRRLRKTAEKLCGGSMQPLLSQLIRETKMTKRERESLRKLLDDMERS